MKTKLVTISWSTTVSIDLPDSINTIEDLQKPSDNPHYKFTTFADQIKSTATDNLSRFDAVITDICDNSDDADQKAVDEFIAKRQAEGKWNGGKAWLNEVNQKS